MNRHSLIPLETHMPLGDQWGVEVFFLFSFLFSKKKHLCGGKMLCYLLFKGV